MTTHFDVPGRAVRYLRSVCPGAPDDPDRYHEFMIGIDRRMGERALMPDGYWVVEIRASWGTGDGDMSLTVDVPLRVLQAEQYASVVEMMEPLW